MSKIKYAELTSGIKIRCTPEFVEEEPEIHYGLNTSGVYAIYCPFYHSIYIGASINIGLRIKSHIGSLNANTHTPILQKHFNKLGINGFEFFKLMNCSDDKNIFEDYFIKKFKTVGYDCYNINAPAGGTRKPKKKSKVSIWKRSRYRSIY